MKPEDYVYELRQAVTWAGLNYEIWWTYQGPDTRPDHVETMNRYNKFFFTSQHAHFVALLMALYRIFEKRRDTYNVPQLLKRLRKHELLDEPKLDELEQMHMEARNLWEKVSTLRNEAFGHRSNKLDIGDVFKKANIRPEDIRTLIEKTEELMNTLTKSLNRSVHSFNYGSGHETVRLLENLGR
jgi:HEPN domain-containing protein